MQSGSRFPRVIVLGAVLALGISATLLASAQSGSQARLTEIRSRVDDQNGIVSIEATDPVPYVASQPDPHTFIVELRDVEAAGVLDHFSADARSPISGVRIEHARAIDGTSVARIRMTLTDTMRPRVRSARNIIFVEAERLDRRPAASAAAAPTVATAVTAATAPAVDPIAALLASAPVLAAPVVPPVPPAPVVTQVTATAVIPAAAVAVPAAAQFAAMQAAPAGQRFGVPIQPGPVAQQAAPPAQAPQGGPTVPATATPRYSGMPVSLDFQGADLRAVLRTFAEISGLNIVIDPTIQGTVDVALRDVPWDQALDIILRANRLGYVVDGTVVRIAPLNTLSEEEGQRRKLADEQALAGELRVMTRALSYARAADLSALLTKTVLSQRGSIETDTRTNTLIINDLPERLERANALLTTLDSPQPQVEIEARIVQTTRDFARSLGVQWGFNGRAAAATGNTLPFAFPNTGNIAGRTSSVQGSGDAADTTNSVVNLGVTGASSALGLALGSVNGALNLDVALSALERAGQGRLLSTPRVSTQNNIEAEITQGVQIPIQTVANNTVTVSFKDAALTLRVTPQITAADTVIMRIAVENASPDFSRSVNNIPPIDTQRANTQVLVSNGETTVIGGIYVSREQQTQDRTPGLYRLPLLGWLFKRDGVTDESRELLIFITPRIIRL
jgi:type IV pilus secretin PilQ/predicted competence protein